MRHGRGPGGWRFHHHRRRWGGPGAYLRHRLRRRIFVWFGVSILLTGAASAAIMWMVASPGKWFEREIDHIRTFASHRFADVWDEPDARARLAQGMADDLRLGVAVRDDTGIIVSRHGLACRDDVYTIPVVRDGMTLGHVDACLADGHHPVPRAGIIWILVAGGVLWAASGAIALRLTRPLVHLVEVTRRIGAGELDVADAVPRFGYGEFRVIGEAVQDMAARIRKQLDDQRELLAAVSHELRTPLGHLRVLIDLSAQAGADPKWVTELEREVLAIDTMVAQLLASSRVDFGNLQRRELDAVELSLRALERAGLDPTLLDAEVESIDVQADAALVLQALANMLRNAAEHGEGVAALEVRATDREVTWRVLDDGPGFGTGLASAFDAFARGPQRKARAGSLGLGLALVRRIAEAHGGAATATDRPEGGAAVRLTIPRKGPVAEED